MRVLLTGASGFLGRYLIKKLQSENCDIVAFVRNSSVLEKIRNSKIEFIYGDLRDKEVLKKALENVDVIIHAAATMRGDWHVYNQVNVKSTELFLEHIKNSNIKRFVFISSIIVYDHTNAEPGAVFEEARPYELDNLTNYSRSKIEAEKVIHKYHKEHGVPTVIIRPGALYGNGGPIYPARLGFAAGGAYLLIGEGKTELPLTHVNSVADAVWISLNNEKSIGQAYNIVEDGKMNQVDFLKQVKDLALPKLRTLKIPYSIAKPMATVLGKCMGIAGMKSPIRLPYLRLCSTQFYYKNSKAKKQLGWSPQNNFEASIDDMLKDFAERRKPSRFVPLRRGKVIVPTDTKLNVGIVGGGMFAEQHLKILKKFRNANIVALCDPNTEARGQTAKKFKIRNIYADINEMLANEKIDVVHIVTPAQSHLELGLTAIKNKCHVLMEKPVAIDAQEAKVMIEAAHKNKVKLTFDHNHLFDEVMIKAREIFAKGALGQICYVESWYATAYSSNSNNRYLKYDAKDHWVYKLPGSLYQNMISHPISLLTDILGKVTDLKAFTKYMHIVPHMKNDELRVLVQSEKILGSIHMSFSITPRYHFVNIYGTKGTLKVDLLNKYLFLDTAIPMIPKVIVRNITMLKHAWVLFFATIKNALKITTGKYSLFEGNERLIHLFYRSILLDEVVPVSPEEAFYSMEIMDKIWKQINSGSSKKISESGNGKVSTKRVRKTSKTTKKKASLTKVRN